MNTDPKWYVLGGLGLLLLVMLITRGVTFREYSNQEARDICLGIYRQCMEMEENSASESEWSDFEEAALASLNSVATDIESVSSEDSPTAWRYYQAAKYDIPAIIHNRKGASKADRVIAALAMPLSDKRVNEGDKSPGVKLAADTDAERPWDPVIVAVLLLDAAMLAGGVVYWKWGKQ